MIQATYRHFFEQMQRIITDARAKLPLWIVDNLPGNVDDLKSLATVWLDEHSKELQRTGKEAMHFFVHLLFGMVSVPFSLCMKVNQSAICGRLPRR